MWFHDVVYDTHARDNEERSAVLARRVSQDGGLPAVFGDAAYALILRTKHDAAPADGDAAIMVDVDLAILGRPAAEFLEYEAPRKGHGVFNGKSFDAWTQTTGQETVNGKLTALRGDARLILPGQCKELPTRPTELAAMRFFRLDKTSPCFGVGMIVPDNGGRDLFGNKVPPDRKPSVGVHEAGEAR